MANNSPLLALPARILMAFGGSKPGGFGGMMSFEVAGPTTTLAPHRVCILTS
jgi:hypothetical protein